MNVSSQIYEYISKNGPSSPRDIARDCSIDHLAVRQSLMRMRDRGEVYRVRYGVYDLSGEPSQSDGRMIKAANKSSELVDIGRIVDIDGVMSIDPEAWFFVGDDSMSGTLPRHAIVPMQNYRGRHPEDAIYLIRLNGHYTIRRIHNLPEGRIRVTSDNKTYPEFDVRAASSLDIIGRIMT